MGANEELLDQVLAHEIDLSRVSASMQVKVLRQLKQLEQELIKSLIDIDPTGVTALSYRQKRQLALLAQARETIKDTYTKIAGTHGGDLYNLARIETAFTKASLDSVIGVPLNTTALTQAQLSEVVGNTMIKGAKSREWWAGQSRSLTNNFTRQMRMGILQGEGVYELGRRIRGTRAGGFKDGIMAASRREADALVRTSVQAVTNAAREATYEENADIVKGLTWMSTFDQRITDICIARGGKQYTLDKKPIGHDVPWLEGPGRIHWNCRSTSTGIIKSWEELAGPNAIKTGGHPTDIDAAFEKRLKAKGFTDAQIAATKRNARASMDGAVPKDLTMDKWLTGKGEAFQNHLLGTGRAELWRTGKIQLKHLVDDKARSVSLQTLMQKHGIKPTPKPKKKPKPKPPPTGAAPPAAAVPQGGGGLRATATGSAEFDGWVDDVFSQAPKTMQNAIKGTRPLTQVAGGEFGTPHYNPSIQGIVLEGEGIGATFKPKTSGRAKYTMRHEYGHYMDFNTRYDYKVILADDLTDTFSGVSGLYKDAEGATWLARNHDGVWVARRQADRHYDLLMAISKERKTIMGTSKAAKKTRVTIAQDLQANSKVASARGSLNVIEERLSKDLFPDERAHFLAEKLKHEATLLESQAALGDRAFMDIADPDSFGKLTDYFGAITNEKVGWGHGKSYYSQFPELYHKQGQRAAGVREGHYTQAFANLTDMYSDANPARWGYVREKTPRIADAFEKYLKDLEANPYPEELWPYIR